MSHLPSMYTIIVASVSELASYPASFADGDYAYAQDTKLYYKYDNGAWAATGTSLPQNPGAYDVRTYGAVGNGTTDDTTAINAAIAAATVAGIGVKFSPGTYAIQGTVTSGAPVYFDPGASVVVVPQSQATFVLAAGYVADRSKVFDSSVAIQIYAMRQGEILPEHFGAQVMTDPRNQSTPQFDSTLAFQRMFESISAMYYPVPNGGTPGGYAPATIRITGWYGISDEIRTSGGAGMTILGNGIGLTGSGLRWIGPDVVGNASKCMLRMYGPQFALIEGIQFIGLPTTTDANRLFAGLVFESNNAPPSPYYGEMGRRSIVRRCIFGDDTGDFNINPALGHFFQRGWTTAGINGNDDFHILEDVIVDRADDSIAIENDQNVYIQLRNVGTGRFTNSGIWMKQGTDLSVDGWYYYNAGSASTALRLGPMTNSNNVRISLREVGGEGNDNILGFCACTDNAAQVFMSFERAEIEQLEGKPFFVGTNPNAVLHFLNSQVSGDFIQSYNAPGARMALTFDSCRGVSNTRVQNQTGYGLIYVDIRNSWANTYSATPTAFQNATPQRFLGLLNGRYVFTSSNAGTIISLGDVTLYGKTSLDAHHVGFGQRAFGIESTFVNEAFKFTTVTGHLNKFLGIVPAESLVLGVQAFAVGANWNDGHYPGFGGCYIGDGTTVDRYGYLGAGAGFNKSTSTSGHVPTLAGSAQDVVLTCVYLVDTYTWNGTTLTSTGNFLTADLVGSTFRMKTGPLAGQSATVTGFTDGQHVTLSASQASASGTGYFDAAFVAGTEIAIVPIYMQTFAGGFEWPSLNYVAQVTPTT